MRNTDTPSSLLPLLPVLAAVWPCAACAGAPSIAVAGAYFPAWLTCALIGVGGALVARVAMVASGVARWLPLQLLVSASLGLMCGAAAWVAWIGF
jgi:hypothetical protein